MGHTNDSECSEEEGRSRVKGKDLERSERRRLNFRKRTKRGFSQAKRSLRKNDCDYWVVVYVCGPIVSIGCCVVLLGIIVFLLGAGMMAGACLLLVHAENEQNNMIDSIASIYNETLADNTTLPWFRVDIKCKQRIIDDVLLQCNVYAYVSVEDTEDLIVRRCSKFENDKYGQYNIPCDDPAYVDVLKANQGGSTRNVNAGMVAGGIILLIVGGCVAFFGFCIILLYAAIVCCILDVSVF